jgi:predicted transposase YbfD/YdcC
MVEAEVERGRKRSRERRYYLCSTPIDARLFARAVRCHWAIESAPQAQERKVRDELTDRAQAA